VLVDPPAITVTSASLTGSPPGVVTATVMVDWDPGATAGASELRSPSATAVLLLVDASGLLVAGGVMPRVTLRVCFSTTVSCGESI
jgi:hypothetical protein